jgi:hypothetical protein
MSVSSNQILQRRHSSALSFASHATLVKLYLVAAAYHRSITHIRAGRMDPEIDLLLVERRKLHVECFQRRSDTDLAGMAHCGDILFMRMVGDVRVRVARGQETARQRALREEAFSVCKRDQFRLMEEEFAMRKEEAVERGKEEERGQARLREIEARLRELRGPVEFPQDTYLRRWDSLLLVPANSPANALDNAPANAPADAADAPTNAPPVDTVDPVDPTVDTVDADHTIDPIADIASPSATYYITVLWILLLLLLIPIYYIVQSFLNVYYIK